MQYFIKYYACTMNVIKPALDVGKYVIYFET